MTTEEKIAAIIEWKAANANEFSFRAPLSERRLRSALQAETLDGDSISDAVRLERVETWRRLRSASFAVCNPTAMIELDKILGTRYVAS